MYKRSFNIFGTILCSILTTVAIVLFYHMSGTENYPIMITIACFAVWMLFGVYRGLYHLLSKPKKKLCPTFSGVGYNVLPISNYVVVWNFFNPLKMKFRTVGSLFTICALAVGMKYFSPKFAVIFWIFVAFTIVLKIYLLIRYLQLNMAQNRLGKVMLEKYGDIDICRYNVTASLINSANTTPEHVIAPIRPYVNVSGSYEDSKRDMSQFSIYQRHILLVSWYISEVYWDSHYVYFSESVGMLYLDTIEALRAIGANEYAKILEDAVSEFDGINHPLLDLEQRADSINKLNLDFEDSDKAIYSLDEFGEKIADLQMAYIRSHIEDFLFDNPYKHTL